MKKPGEVQECETDNSFKYVMQDTSYIYIGARFQYQELLQEDQLAFKVRTILSQYILKEVDSQTALESHFYDMTPDSFSCRTYQELKVRIKASVPVRKKTLTGKEKLIYKDQIFEVAQLAQIDPARKKQMGLILREIIFSKLGVMTFTV